ncbi:MAG TPA: type II toxin-antitoxin system antitoxin SocA domain-containing protein, partial [Nitrososphaera sp.]|nr:type II toxin-antitoxin system antitoxin SocA domain-containing protein [Nitrososphaera sp.]
MAGEKVGNDEKLENLILYISLKSKRSKTFGAIKLNKILFFSDQKAYVEMGRSITGQEYQALKQGPCPRRMKPVQDQLVQGGKLRI